MFWSWILVKEKKRIYAFVYVCRIYESAYMYMLEGRGKTRPCMAGKI